MLQDILPEVYDLTYRSEEIRDDDFIIIGDLRKQIIVINGKIPCYKEVKHLINEKPQYLFSIGNNRYFTVFEDVESNDYMAVRRLFPLVDNKEAFAASTGYHLNYWYRTHQYCGTCGNKMIPYHRERAMHCQKCGNVVYPVIAPAVIIALIKGDSILMSQYAHRSYKGRALLAGFCEIGETPEETCKREVMEEVGLRIKNIRYFGSQPWGIDSNLLLGYVVEADGDDPIVLDENELAKAVWVKRENIEYSSELKSLTATMIEAFRLGKI